MIVDFVGMNARLNTHACMSVLQSISGWPYGIHKSPTVTDMATSCVQKVSFTSWRREVVEAEREELQTSNAFIKLLMAKIQVIWGRVIDA